jgi:hypothetical protein
MSCVVTEDFFNKIRQQLTHARNKHRYFRAVLSCATLARNSAIFAHAPVNDVDDRSTPVSRHPRNL